MHGESPLPPVALMILLGILGFPGAEAEDREGVHLRDLTLDPPNPQPGDEVTFSVLTENVGNRETWADVSFEIDGIEKLYGGYVDALRPGESRLVKSDPWKAWVGSHSVETFVVTWNATEARANFTIPHRTGAAEERGADLVVEHVSLKKEDDLFLDFPPAYTAQFYTVRIRNQGTAPAGPSHFVLATDWPGYRSQETPAQVPRIDPGKERGGG